LKILVTGANGFIGSNLCADLIRDGYAVCGLVRPSGERTFLEGLEPLKVFEGDITDPESLKKAAAGVEVIYNVAGYSSDWGPWATFRRVNVAGVGNVMEAARKAGVKRVVHISSVSVYGFPGKTNVAEDSPLIPQPDDPYITTKAEGERLAMSYNGKGLKVAVIRPAGVYGPNDRTTTLQLAPVLVAGKFAHVDGGRHAMAPVYIDNLVQMMRLASENADAPGQAFNAVDDGMVTWREFIDWMCADLGCPAPKLSAPGALVWPLSVLVENTAKVFGKTESPLINKYRVRAVMRDSHYSTEKAKKLLGYRPKVSTREGVRRTIAWYHRYAGLGGNGEAET